MARERDPGKNPFLQQVTTDYLIDSYGVPRKKSEKSPEFRPGFASVFQ